LQGDALCLLLPLPLTGIQAALDMRIPSRWFYAAGLGHLCLQTSQLIDLNAESVLNSHIELLERFHASKNLALHLHVPAPKTLPDPRTAVSLSRHRTAANDLYRPQPLGDHPCVQAFEPLKVCKLKRLNTALTSFMSNKRFHMM